MRWKRVRAAHPESGRRALSALGAAIALTISTSASARTSIEPTLAVIEIGAVDVLPVELDGGNAATCEALADLLAAQAAVSLHRLALEEQLAATAMPAVGAPRLTATLELPTSLPAGVSGSRAAFRSGRLAIARLHLVAADGYNTLAHSAAEVQWDDVRWTQGGPKNRRARRPEAALADAVDRVLQRGVRMMVRELLQEVGRIGSAATTPAMQTHEVEGGSK